MCCSVSAALLGVFTAAPLSVRSVDHQRSSRVYESLSGRQGCECRVLHVRVCLFITDNMVEDMDVDLDKEFLQELKELKILISDRDLLDQHKRSKKHKTLDICI